MAFDRPLEADKVDDLGLLSSFVRAPILGPLVWILGRNMEKSHSQDENITVIEAQTNSTSLDSGTRAPAPHRDAPDLSGSDVSCIGDEICSIDEDSFDESHSDDSTKAEHDSAAKSKRRRRALKNTRKTSWSDESGQRLVEYCDEVLHGTNAVQKSCRKPIKSAIRKSRNGSDNMSCHPSQCVPTGLSGGSISMPSGGGMLKAGNVALSGGNGYISPQSPSWGWYISTTPPTPEKYHASTGKGAERNLLQHPISGRQTTGYRPLKPAVVSVFKRVANDVPNCTHGWPSVPL